MIIREAQDERVKECCPVDVFNAKPILFDGLARKTTACYRRVRKRGRSAVIHVGTVGGRIDRLFRRQPMKILAHTSDVSEVSPACSSGSAFSACAVYAFSVTKSPYELSQIIARNRPRALLRNRSPVSGLGSF
jgi:hypothetical protein